jgi:hypothetical protein
MSNQGDCMKTKAKPVKRSLKVIHRNTMLFRILSKLPLAISPFRLIAVRVGSDYLNYYSIVWRF